MASRGCLTSSGGVKRRSGLEEEEEEEEGVKPLLVKLLMELPR